MKKILILLLFPLFSFTQPKSVTDKAGVLNDYDIQQLNDQIQEFRKASSIGIIVNIVETTEDESIEEYTASIRDNPLPEDIKGLIVYTIAIKDRKTDIWVSPIISRYLTKSTIKNILGLSKPYLVKGDYYRGVQLTIVNLTHSLTAISWETRTKTRQESSSANTVLAIFTIVALISLIYFVGKAWFNTKDKEDEELREYRGKIDALLGPLHDKVISDETNRLIQGIKRLNPIIYKHVELFEKARDAYSNLVKTHINHNSRTLGELKFLHNSLNNAWKITDEANTAIRSNYYAEHFKETKVDPTITEIKDLYRRLNDARLHGLITLDQQNDYMYGRIIRQYEDKVSYYHYFDDMLRLLADYRKLVYSPNHIKIVDDGPNYQESTLVEDDFAHIDVAT